MQERRVSGGRYAFPSHPPTPVGAGLPAKAVYQHRVHVLIHRFREQARSHLLTEVALRTAYMNFLLETSRSFLGKMPPIPV